MLFLSRTHNMNKALKLGCLKMLLWAIIFLSDFWPLVIALKGQNIPAQGSALGILKILSLALKGRNISQFIKIAPIFNFLLRPYRHTRQAKQSVLENTDYF